MESVKELIEHEFVEIFGYKVIKTEPLENLENYKEHRRLRVYYHKGTECSNPSCNRKGTKLVHGVDNFGNIHIDLVDDNLFPITIDHIFPKSRGGSNNIVNLKPMCKSCNTYKGAEEYTGEILPGMVRPDWEKFQVKKNIKKNKQHIPPNCKKIKDVSVGDNVYKKSKKKIIYLGKILDIRINEKHPLKVLAAQIEGMDIDSLYSLSALFKIEKY